MDRQPLEKWVHSSGRVALLGDSCHPMLVRTSFPSSPLHTQTHHVCFQPYRAQGAAMAIEDAAVLGNLFSRLSHPSQITPLLLAYEKLRLKRTADTQGSSRLNQYIFHLPDGPEQEARDASMRAAMDAEFRMLNGEDVGLTLEGSSNQWADRKKNEMQFGYDADLVADRFWAEVGEKEIGSLGQQAVKVNGRL